MEIYGNIEFYSKKFNHLKYINKLLTDEDIAKEMKQVFSQIPDNVLTELEGGEVDEKEKFFDKNGKQLDASDKAAYCLLNNNSVVSFKIKTESFALEYVVNKALYDNGNNNPYDKKFMKKYCKVDIGPRLPRAVLKIRKQDEEDLEVVDKILFENRATGDSAIVTMQHKGTMQNKNEAPKNFVLKEATIKELGLAKEEK